jgi:hypothetical protein
MGGFFRVVRPDDWTGLAVRIVVGIAGLWLLAHAFLGPLPGFLIALCGNNQWIARAIVLVIGWYSWTWLRALITAALPRAVVLIGRRLRFRRRARRVVVDLRDIVHADVELRPPIGEVFVIELRSGQVIDLCPVHWDGADRLWARLKRRITTVR